MFYSPPFLEDLGVPRVWIGPAHCLGLSLEVVLFRWKPGFVRSWSYPTTIMVGCLALVLRHLLFTLSHNPWLLCASYLLAGVVIVFYHIGISILVNTLAGAEVRATAQTLLVFFGSGLGPMLANWVAGHVATRFHGDLRPVFLFAAVLGALAGLLIFSRRHSLARTSHQSRPPAGLVKSPD
jgi:MFS family permease